MVLGQPIDHLGERAQPGRGQNARLAHTAAHHLAHAASALDEIDRPGQHGADRRAQSLGEAEHHGIHRGGELPDVNPLGDCGIEDAGAIEMDLQAGLVGHHAERRGLVWAQTAAALAVVGVLQAEQRTAWLVDIRFSDSP